MPARTTLTPAYARYVLALLFVAYVFNFIDRQILAILLQPIKEELQVSDTAMGLLTGIAFALFYTCAGIPIARLADRRSRRTIIAVGLAAWSVMTAASGMVRTFAQLAVARIGVGVGEAAFVPPAHSLISDYFPAERRATAMAVFSLGVHVGLAFGFVLGGWIAQFFGWRAAFFAVGVPGLILAVVVRLTVREPARGHADGARDLSHGAAVSGAPASEPLRVVFHILRTRRAFRHLALAAALHSFGGYAFAIWGPTFFVRVHGMMSGRLGTWLGAILGVGGAAGAILGGVLADRLGARDARWQLYVPAMATVLQIPCALVTLLWPSPVPALLFLIPSAMASAIWFGPVFSLTQALVPPTMRATASAVLLFVINLIGLGIAPLAVGILNDRLAATYGAEAIRYSLMIVGFAGVLAALHFSLAARTIRADLAAARRA
ncbi:MAG: MFS transporter [Deltaproteobacteria bacterium]|nr:MFS transporter [Deltaproteobacteria bacterium]